MLTFIYSQVIFLLYLELHIAYLKLAMKKVSIEFLD